MEHPFMWYDILPSPLRLLPQHTFTALLVMALLLVLACLARRSLSQSADPVVPEDGVSIRNVFELLVELIVGLSDGIIGLKGRKYVHLFGSFFIFILTANLFGLLPGFSPPTNNLNTTLGLGLVSFCAYHYFGMREHGAGYIKQFLGPMLVLAPLVSVIQAFVFTLLSVIYVAMAISHEH